MHLALVLSLGAAAVANAAISRNILYFDQWHTTELPPKNLTGAVTHVMMSFANSSLFAAQPAGKYKPFQSIKQVRQLFDHELNVCLSIGGWGDNSGFDEGVKTSSSRERFAKSIASTVDRLGFDCVGCPTELLEDDDDGSDTGKSGSMTFEAANFAERPAKLTTTPDNTCGAGTNFKCAEGSCCGGSGWCSFHQALKNGYTDEEKGAQWYWDAKTRIFWSWETPELIQKKISFLADTYGIKSVMAWALAQDSNDWSHLKAMQKGFVGVNT
uniref:chitinase n=1 Tax=Fusarium oxysporum (strain Fo5176) TaxID=660025 RepID=A0A0D2YKN1_FUSOF